MSKVAKQFHYQVKSLNTGWARNQISPSTSIHTVSQQVILNFVESLLACVYPSCLPRTHEKLPFKLLSSLMPQPSFFCPTYFNFSEVWESDFCCRVVDTTAMLRFPHFLIPKQKASELDHWVHCVYFLCLKHHSVVLCVVWCLKTVTSSFFSFYCCFSQKGKSGTIYSIMPF